MPRAGRRARVRDAPARMHGPSPHQFTRDHPLDVFFVVFEMPVFSQFREQVARRLSAAGRDPSLFDPTALSPVLIAADLDGTFSSWQPLRADPPNDCFAPVVVQ